MKKAFSIKFLAAGLVTAGFLLGGGAPQYAAAEDFEWDWAYWESIGIKPPGNENHSRSAQRQAGKSRNRSQEAPRVKPEADRGGDSQASFEWDDAYWESIGVPAPQGAGPPSAQAASLVPAPSYSGSADWQADESGSASRPDRQIKFAEDPPTSEEHGSVPSPEPFTWDRDYWKSQSLTPPDGQALSPRQIAMDKEAGRLNKWDYSFSTGYRQDDLNWNIAGSVEGTDPNILSELTWRNLDIYFMRGDIQYELEDRFISRFNFDYGLVLNGSNQDSDYFLNNRESEFSRSDNASDTGYVFDISLGVGYPFSFNEKRFRFIPMMGYSIHRQNFNITDGFQTSSTIGQPLGPFPGLHSRYQAQWYGPWNGADLVWSATNKLTFKTTFEYHWESSYAATANWNLRSDFKHPESFIQETDGWGIIGSIGAEYEFRKNWLLSAHFDAQNFRGNAGLDRVFFIDNSSLDTRFNEVNWDSYGGRLGLTYRY